MNCIISCFTTDVVIRKMTVDGSPTGSLKNKWKAALVLTAALSATAMTIGILADLGIAFACFLSIPLAIQVAVLVGASLTLSVALGILIGHWEMRGCPSPCS